MDKINFRTLHRIACFLKRNQKCLSIQRSLWTASNTLDAEVKLQEQPVAAEDVKQLKIKIPQRIERNPTDILYALKGTISRDPTAPEYKYHDDPYLIPYSNLTKRSYALSKESGKKAAMWVRQQHADLFQHRVAEPPIETFWPKPVFKEDEEVNEETLLKFIQMNLMSEAIKVYEKMQNQKLEISLPTKQKMLEYVAYYNEAEPLNEELIEERWYTTGMQARDTKRKSWKNNGLAESIFKELDPPDQAAICTMIRGCAKYFDGESAWKLYQDALSREIDIDTETYNSLIRVSCFLKDNGEMVWELITELLNEMVNKGVQPNVGTLNSILEILSIKGNFRQSKNLALQTLSEFYQIGVEPSLASYYHLIITFGRGRTTVLPDIIHQLQGKSFTIQDPKDIFFFVTAMEVCRYHLQDLELANKINQLLHTGKNYDLIGDSLKESIYYRHYFYLKCGLEPFNTFMEFYELMVPNIYTPEPSVMEEILKAMELNGSFEFLPKLWSDMIIFEQSTRENLLTILLEIMANNISILEASTDLVNEFAKIGWKIWTIIETQDKERGGRLVLWSGQMMGDLLSILVKSDNFEKSCEIIKKLIRGTSDIVGVPNINSLKLFLNLAIENKNGAFCLACIQYVNEAGFAEAIEMAEEVLEKVTLDTVQKAKLNNIICLNANIVKKKDEIESSQNQPQSENV